jgi:hypothetical protein
MREMRCVTRMPPYSPRGLSRVQAAHLIAFATQ